MDGLLEIDVAMAAIGVVAVALNLFLLRILGQEKFTIDGGLMMLIATSDLALGAFVVFSVSLRHADAARHAGFGMCLASSVVFNAATVVTPVLVAQLSMVRYLAIVRGQHVSRGYVGVSLLAMGLVWCLFLWRGLTSPLVLLPSGIACTPRYWGRRVADKLFGLPILAIALPSLVATPVCYYRIMAHYWAMLSFDGHGAQLAKRQLRRQASYIALFMVAYAVAFLPKLAHVLLTTAFAYRRTALADGLVMSLLFTITVTNALFTLLLHEDTRQVVSNLIYISFQSPPRLT